MNYCTYYNALLNYYGTGSHLLQYALKQYIYETFLFILYKGISEYITLKALYSIPLHCKDAMYFLQLLKSRNGNRLCCIHFFPISYF